MNSSSIGESVSKLSSRSLGSVGSSLGSSGSSGSSLGSGSSGSSENFRLESVDEEGGSWMWWLVVVVVVAGAFFFLRPYVQYANKVIELIRSLSDSGIKLAAAMSSGVVDNTATGGKLVVNKISGKKKPPVAKVPVVPDESSSSVQESKKFCYVGEWKGVRSCVKVNGKCGSNQLFETEELCVNPELR